MYTHNKFFIQPSSSVPSASSQIVRLGTPEPAAMISDLCVCCAGSYDFIPMNSLILREALLNSKEFLKNCLGLDIRTVEEAKAAEAVPVKPAKPKQVKVDPVKED